MLGPFSQPLVRPAVALVFERIGFVRLEVVQLVRLNAAAETVMITCRVSEALALLQQRGEEGLAGETRGSSRVGSGVAPNSRIGSGWVGRFSNIFGRAGPGHPVVFNAITGR